MCWPLVAWSPLMEGAGPASVRPPALRARTEWVSSGSFATVLGGPLALERLHAPAGLEALSSPEARLIYRLPEPDRHGRELLRVTPLELLERRRPRSAATISRRSANS